MALSEKRGLLGKDNQRECSLLEEKYEVCDTRALKGGLKVNVIKMCDNFIVLDTR